MDSIRKNNVWTRFARPNNIFSDSSIHCQIMAFIQYLFSRKSLNLYLSFRFFYEKQTHFPKVFGITLSTSQDSGRFQTDHYHKNGHSCTTVAQQKWAQKKWKIDLGFIKMKLLACPLRKISLCFLLCSGGW